MARWCKLESTISLRYSNCPCPLPSFSLVLAQHTAPLIVLIQTCWEIRKLTRFKKPHTTIKKNKTKPRSLFLKPISVTYYHSRGSPHNKSCVSKMRGWQEDWKELLGRESWSQDCSQSGEGYTKLYPECCSAVAFWNKAEALRHFSLVLTPSGHSQDNYNVFWVYKRTRRFCNQESEFMLLCLRAFNFHGHSLAGG